MTHFPLPGTDTFQGRIGRTQQDSTPWWPEPDAATPGSPNVIYVVLDDVGFADLGCYGSEIRTPNIDRLAQNGLRYTNFHTTPLCSPTRASLLTGRNHHSVGMRMLSNLDTGFPSGRGRIAPEAATLAEILRDRGYNTMCVGKWHLAPTEHTTASGPYDQWPLGRGFERFYGFLEAETDCFYPELTYDNHPVDPPSTPAEGYHLSTDLVDKAITFITSQTSITPEKPFFMQLAFASGHAPHQAPRDYMDRQRGRYEHGWDAVREARHAKQVSTGIIPAGTTLAPHNPGVKPWAELSGDEQRFFSRLQEAYAAMLEHTDTQVGRLLDQLEALGRLDNTIIAFISDNGASQEGGSHGSLNTAAVQNLVPEDFESNLARIDEIGGPTVQPNYPWGWAQAGNTPFKRYKQNTHEGGVRDPLIVHWPAGIADRGGIRTQFHHVIDVTATVLALLEVPVPQSYRGVEQMPLHGVDMSYSFGHPAAEGTRKTQHFEMFGHRGLWHEGWKAVAFHARGSDYDADRWELYDVEADWSECHDLAAEQPEKLQEMVDRFWSEAERYGVLPLDDRGFAVRARVPRPGSPRNRTRFTYHPGMEHLPMAATPPTMNRSHSIKAHIEGLSPTDEGVLFSLGGVSSGYVLYLSAGRLHYEYNYLGTVYRISSPTTVPAGTRVLQFLFEKTGDCRGIGRLYLDGVAAGSTDFPAVLPYFHGWHGLHLGADKLSPVSASYPGAFPFTGRLEKVVFDLSDSEETALFEAED